MRETWLNPNRRAIVFGCVPPLFAGALGAWLVFGAGGESRGPWRWMGILLLVAGVAAIGMLLLQLRRPRVAFHAGEVLFYLRSGPPIAVPAEIVEAFFLGQSPVQIPGVAQQPNAVNLIARLSQRHTEWAQQPVKPALGRWCDSYVTIRGTWCERLNGELIRKLNRRLKEVKDSV